MKTTLGADGLALRKTNDTAATCRLELVTSINIKPSDDEEAIKDKALRQIADTLAKEHFWFEVEKVSILATY